jgi:hypothetical protein
MLRRTWRDLGVAHHFVSANLQPKKLSERLLVIAYRLLLEGQFESVLVLVQSAEDAGLINSWLLDSRARALMFLKRYRDARFIWEGMIGVGDDRLERNVQKMLSVCSSRERDLEQDFLRRRLTMSADNLDDLLVLWTRFPTSNLVEKAVHELIQQRLSLENPNWMLLDQTLRTESIALESQLVWLMFIDASLKTTFSVTDWLGGGLSDDDDGVAQEVLAE